MSDLPASEVARVRDLARRFAEVTADPIMDERRKLWSDVNSLDATRPVVLVRGGRAFAETEMLQSRRCADPLCAMLERHLLTGLLKASFGDDQIVEPWISVAAVYGQTGWGLEGTRQRPAEPMGSWKADYPIKSLKDIASLIEPTHVIDEDASRAWWDAAEEVLDGIVPVHRCRAPFWRIWSGDLSTDLGRLRGIEHFMLDMMDHGEWLHRLMRFLSDGVLKAHNGAEAAGDWSLAETENQAMPYCRELPGPAANARPAERKQLWGFFAAQEFALVSPAMHEAFLFAYQRPIMQHFGLVAYGCCEDLTKKIDMLRTLPNLRRIAVTPVADVHACAEQIGTDYAISWRPNPAQMVCCGYDADRIRAIINDGLDALEGLHFDITLKDIDTVEGDPDRLGRWARLVRRLIDERYA
ncbi:MAG: hypothetical protein ACOC95_01680 [Planctomycetota bacterium]